MTATKLPYERPMIVNLSGSEAFAAPGKQCKAGSVAEGNVCVSGGSPGYSCQPGATATGDKCMSGSVAGKQCMDGSVAEAQKCHPGALATTDCKFGQAAVGNCKSGTIVGRT